MDEDEYHTLFNLQRNARDAGNCEQAVAVLTDMHRQYHDQAWRHVAIHWHSALTFFAMKRYLSAFKELFVIPFAPPASLVQKHFGLARKDI